MAQDAPMPQKIKTFSIPFVQALDSLLQKK